MWLQSCPNAVSVVGRQINGRKIHQTYFVAFMHSENYGMRWLLHGISSYSGFHNSISLHRYTKTGVLAIAGFCDPHKDSLEEDLKLWMPDADNPPTDLELLQARFLLAKVADQFCDLFVQEKMAMPENMAGSK